MNNPTRPQIDALITATFNKKKGERVDNYYLPADATADEHRDLIEATEEYYRQLQREHLTQPPSNGLVTKSSHFSKFPEGTAPHTLNTLFAERNLTPPPAGSEDFTYTMRGLQEAELEVTRLELARLQGANPHELTPQGRFSPSYREFSLKPGLSIPYTSTETIPTIAECIDELVASKVATKHWKESKLVEYQPKLRRFGEFMATRYPNKVCLISSVTYRDLADYHAYLQTVPRMNKPSQTIGYNTIKGHMGAVGQLMKFARQRSYIITSPYQPELLTTKKQEGDTENYRDFTKEELIKLFGSAYYNDRKHFGKTSNWWAPLLGLFTGARQGELVELRTTDIMHEAGVDYINITSTDERDIKNKWSKRTVPIHPVLIEAGFLKFVQERRKTKQKALFPDLTEKAEDPQGAYSTRFGRLLDKLEMVDPLLVYHSFRHTFISRIWENGVEKDNRMAITGHAGEDVHDSYGKRPSVGRLAIEINKLEYYGIDWKSLLVVQDKPKPNRKKRVSSPYRKSKE